MAETIFAGENVEEFALEKGAAIFTTFVAIILPFAENFLLRYRPGNAGNDHRENHKPENLIRNRHL